MEVARNRALTHICIISLGCKNKVEMEVARNRALTQRFGDTDTL